MKVIFADFDNTDTERRIRLITAGTLADIDRQQIQLQEGLELILDDNDELRAIGIVQFSGEENIWVAKIDWSQFD